MTATILVAILAIAPGYAPQQPIVDVSDVEIEPGGDGVDLTTFDADGEVSSEVALGWIDDGHVWQLVKFPDGHYCWSDSDGDTVTTHASDPAICDVRLASIEDGLRKLTEEEANECLFAMLALGGGLLAKTPSQSRSGRSPSTSGA